MLLQKYRAIANIDLHDNESAQRIRSVVAFGISEVPI